MELYPVAAMYGMGTKLPRVFSVKSLGFVQIQYVDQRTEFVRTVLPTELHPTTGVITNPNNALREIPQNHHTFALVDRPKMDTLRTPGHFYLAQGSFRPC